jgi:hypothetical protein
MSPETTSMTKRLLACGLLAIAIAACENPLAISNQNSPDRGRVFTNAKDLEVFVSGLFGVWHACTIGGSNDGIHTQAMVMGMENTSALANFAMGPRGAIPRSQIDNNRGGQGNAGNFHDWFRCHRAARQAALGIQALQNLSLGSVTADNRAKMFARLVQGLALGNLSLTYDSASIITELTNPTAGAGEIVPLSAFQAVNTAALGFLDSAITMANANPGAFPLPTTANFWINGIGVTQAQFVQIARSYKALFRANVARTPAGRAAVDWAQVIADADAGLTADLDPQMDPTNGWDVSWVVQAFATGSANWHQMSQFWLGMADSSGGYDNWLNTAPASRVAFVVVSADRRIPSGTGCFNTLPCPAAVRTSQQGAAGTGSAGQAFANTPYFRNRPSGEDQPGSTLQISMYDFWRSRAFRQASRIGRYPILTASNIRLLAAEGYLRTNDFATAMTRINVSRTGKGVLPALAGIANGDTAAVVPGGAGCVPRVPNIATGFKSTKCGNIWDALKWEYRMETAYTGYGNWYFASRGWGDLPEGTAIHWPVPYDEMDTRSQAFYPAGGKGTPTGAQAGNYGLFAPGGVY